MPLQRGGRVAITQGSLQKNAQHTISECIGNPTVETGEYALRPDIPELGRRVLLDWEREGMPPNEGIARLPDSLRPGQPLARHTVEELSQEKFEEIFSVLSDPLNWQEWPSASDIQEAAEHVPESTSSDLSLLERDLQKFLARNLNVIESGLKANAEYQLEEYPTDVGLIDLLCQDTDGRWVVIELKAGFAGDAAIGQILGYIAWVRENLPNGRNARGILVCKEPHPRVLAVAKMFPDISVKRFQLNFLVEDAQ